MNNQQHIAEAKQKIKEALKELEEATGEVVEDIGIDRLHWQSFSEEGYCVVKTVLISFKENPVEGWG